MNITKIVLGLSVSAVLCLIACGDDNGVSCQKPVYCYNTTLGTTVCDERKEHLIELRNELLKMSPYEPAVIFEDCADK